MKNPLTNSTKCGIIKVQRGTQGRSGKQDPRESNKSLTMKSSIARCVGLRDTNVHQCRFAEVMTDYAYYKATASLVKGFAKNKKLLKNPLTNQKKIWYNKYIKGKVRGKTKW